MGIVVGALASCSPSTPASDAGVLPDAPETIDARTATSANVECKDFIHKAVAVDGSATTTNSYSYALVDVGPMESATFKVVLCGYTIQSIPPSQTTPCPVGYTCTDTGGVPPTPDCSISSGDGQFSNGKLLLNCGYGQQTKNNTTGAITGYTVSYSDIRVLVE